MAIDPDSEIAEKIAAAKKAASEGDAAELGNLLQSYFNYLTVLANTQLDRRLRQRLNPSDLVQETMLAAHRDFGAFRGQSPGELVGWLRQILIHVLHGAIDKHVKAEKRDIRREVSIDQMRVSVDQSAMNLAGILAANTDSPSSPVLQAERARELADCLAELRPDYAEVITLRNLQGLSFDDVAEKMGRSSGAARMLWLRAIEQFKKVYSPSDG